MAGITIDGFERKRLDTILDELNQELKAIFGENLNLDPETPDGQVSGVFSESHANLWELAEAGYNAFNPSAATGDVLSNLVQLNGIVRQPATFSTVELSLTGTNSTVIPLGSLVSTDDGIFFATDEEVTIAAGTATVDATATITGPQPGVTSTIVNIDTPLTGWDTVTNAEDAVLGQLEETDAELRTRREKSVTREAVAIPDAIIAEVENIEGVTHTSIKINETNSTDGDGIPAHSFLVIAEGGIDLEVATAIYNEKSIAIGTFGTTTVNVLDSQGIGHDINFSRPILIDIHIQVTITTFSDFPQNGDDLIKQAIIDYAAGTLVPGRDFGVSDDIVYSELFTPINSVDGVQVDTLYVNTAGSPGPGDTSTIAIDFDERGLFTTVNIEVVAP